MCIPPYKCLSLFFRCVLHLICFKWSLVVAIEKKLKIEYFFSVPRNSLMVLLHLIICQPFQFMIFFHICVCACGCVSVLFAVTFLFQCIRLSLNLFSSLSVDLAHLMIHRYAIQQSIDVDLHKCMGSDQSHTCTHVKPRMNEESAQTIQKSTSTERKRYSEVKKNKSNRHAQTKIND